MTRAGVARGTIALACALAVVGALAIVLHRQQPVEAVEGDWPVVLEYERWQVSEPRLDAPLQRGLFVFEGRGWNDWRNELVDGNLAGLGPGWFERVAPSGRIEKGRAGRVEHVSEAEGRHLPGPFLSPAWFDRWQQHESAALASSEALVADPDAASAVADRLGVPPEVVVAYTVVESVTCQQLGFVGCERDAEFRHDVAVHAPTGLPLRLVERYGDVVVGSYEVTVMRFGDT